jgi:trimeric autotransporter adhesin
LSNNHIRSNVIGHVAFFLALTGGVAWANHPGGADTISSGDIINNEVRSVDLANGEVKTDDLAANSVGSNKIADQSVKNADLSIGASSSNTIADGGIQGVDVKNDTLTGTQIDEATLSGVPSTNAWSLIGNSGTSGANFLGTTDNQPLNLRVNDARALRLEPASDGTNQSPNVIGGIADNSVTSGVHSATIAGGGRSDPGNSATANEVTDNYGSVGGGAQNQAGDGSGTESDASFGTVAGGGNNTASGFASTAVGGIQNTAQGDYSLAAGRNATASHDGAFVWADSLIFGFPSTAPNQFSVRSTGGARFVSGIAATTPTSGLELPAGTSGWSTVGIGQPFDVRVNDSRGLRIDPASDGTNQSPNVIGGIVDNQVTAGVHAATISGGGRSDPADAATANRVTDDYGTVGGGADNQAGNGAGTDDDGELATVGGGLGNTASQIESTVGGGFSNTASGFRATVAGGEANIASGEAASVGGGQGNEAGGIKPTVGGGVGNNATGFTVTVGGGVGNDATGDGATVGGGSDNGATGVAATVPGGQSNIASELGATVGGGRQNEASGLDATVPGGAANTAEGNNSFAAGGGAQANHDGAFVWADLNFFDFASTAQNQFSVRSTGGARFVSAIDGSTGAPTAGVELAPGGGSWSSLSDAASKRAVEPVSGRDVLRELASVPISTWSYRSQDDSIRHIGPMAQDFYRAFGVGEDRRHISSVDADGVALAAIKGLNRKLHRKLEAERRRRHEQERRLAQLEARLAALER